MLLMNSCAQSRGERYAPRYLRRARAPAVGPTAAAPALSGGLGWGRPVHAGEDATGGEVREVLAEVVQPTLRRGSDPDLHHLWGHGRPGGQQTGMHDSAPAGAGRNYFAINDASPDRLWPPNAAARPRSAHLQPARRLLAHRVEEAEVLVGLLGPARGPSDGSARGGAAAAAHQP